MSAVPLGDKRAFVKVEPDVRLMFMVADLPKTGQPLMLLVKMNSSMALSLTDRELMELLILELVKRSSAAIPLMTDEQKTLALKTLAHWK